MPANIINSGTPLNVNVGRPLWTDLCDASAYLPNTASPADTVIPISNFSGYVEALADVVVSDPNEVEEVIVSGVIKGRKGDQFSLALQHEKLGSVVVMQSRTLNGSLSTPYQNQMLEVETYMSLQPNGSQFIRQTAPSKTSTITVPKGTSINSGGYLNGYNTNLAQLVPISISPEGTTTQISVPAHRNPWEPNYNFDIDSVDRHAASYSELHQNVRYTPLVGNNSPFEVATTFFETDPVSGSGTWGAFLAQDYNTFSEKLYADFGAHRYDIIKTQTLSTTVSGFLAFYTRYTVRFVKYPDVAWLVTPLGTETYEVILPPKAIYRIYPPDFSNYSLYSERQESFSFSYKGWRQKALEGLLSLTYSANGASYLVAEDIPGVTLATPKIDGLTITIKHKANQVYTSSVIAPTTSGSVKTASTSGNLMTVSDDRCIVSVLCGIGSDNTGIWCGYEVSRISPTDPIYSIQYFISTTCNIHHVNMARPVQTIGYKDKDWSGMSTHGNDGQNYVTPQAHQIYPIKGAIGLKVIVDGTRLRFSLQGNYPELVYEDPTVALIDRFLKYTLNA